MATLRPLPCVNCKDGALIVAGRPTAALPPDGALPYLIGRPPLPFPHQVHCHRCKRKTRLTAADWARLPKLTTEQLEDLGVLGTYTKDLRGAGFPDEQARDLFRFGWTPTDLAALPGRE